MPKFVIFSDSLSRNSPYFSAVICRNSRLLPWSFDDIRDFFHRSFAEILVFFLRDSFLKFVVSSEIVCRNSRCFLWSFDEIHHFFFRDWRNSRIYFAIVSWISALAWINCCPCATKFTIFPLHLIDEITWLFCEQIDKNHDLFFVND